MKKRILGLFSALLLVVLLAACGAKQFTVTYDANGGSPTPIAIKVESGNLLEIPEEPTKEDFVFEYWALGTEGGSKWNFGKDKVTKNITLVAKWKEPDPVYYTVRFYALEGTPVPENQEVIENGTVTKPADPTREGYHFLGWYVDNDLYDFTAPVTADLIISARWQKIEYVTVTFNLAYEDAPLIDDEIIEKGKTVTEPEEPIREGYNFLGWYLGNNKFNFENVVSSNVNLTAKWELIIIRYDVTFDIGYAEGESPETQSVVEGEVAEEPEMPVRAGYKFLGWYLEDATEAYDFATLVTEALTLTARWQKQHTVNFYLDAAMENLHEAIKVYDGELVDLPTEPELAGYRFDAWYLDEEPFDELAPIVGDINVIAHWKEEFVVKFYLDDEATEIYTQFLVVGGGVSPTPTEPTKDFHNFLGWYLGEATEAYDFTTPVTGNLELRGKWEAEAFVARAYIGEQAYQSISLAVEAATAGDTILIADSDHTLPVTVDKNNLTFKPLTAETVAVIESVFTLAAGIDGITFDGLSFTGGAYIHCSGVIDNFTFTNNKVYGSTIEAGDYKPANRTDVNAFIRLWASAGEDIVGNVTITNNTFTGMQAVIVSVARTSAGKTITFTDNVVKNSLSSSLRFDGGYNNGTYDILRNTFENDEGVENISVITFRCYSSVSTTVAQEINIKNNTFTNVGSTAYPMEGDHPGSGVITFSVYNEHLTIVAIEDNTFTNTGNAVHFRDNRGEHTYLSLSLQNNTFEDGTGFIFFESNYRATDPNINLGANTYIVAGVTVTEEDVIERIIRTPDA